VKLAVAAKSSATSICRIGFIGALDKKSLVPGVWTQGGITVKRGRNVYGRPRKQRPSGLVCRNSRIPAGETAVETFPAFARVPLHDLPRIQTPASCFTPTTTKVISSPCKAPLVKVKTPSTIPVTICVGEQSRQADFEQTCIQCMQAESPNGTFIYFLLTANTGSDFPYHGEVVIPNVQSRTALTPS